MNAAHDNATSTAGRPRPPRRVRRRWVRPRVVFGALLVVVVIAVMVAYVVPTRRWLYATGHVMTRQVVTIRPSVAGVIGRFLVDSGTLVEKGDLVIQLQDDVQRAAMEELTSQLSVREAELLQLTEAQELERAQRAAQVERARLSLRLAEHYLERLKKAGKETISQVKFEEHELKAELASNRLKELKLPHDPLMEQQIAVVKEKIAASRKRVPLLEAELKLRQIRAPVRGTVVFHSFVAGEVVSVNDELGQVFDRDGWIARLKLSERQIAFVRPDQPGQIALAAYSPMRHGYLEGRTLPIDKVVTPRAAGDAIFYLEAAVTPRDGFELHPGMTAWAYIDGGETNWLHRVVGW